MLKNKPLMQAEQLLKLLHDPHKITPEDVTALHNLLRLYPYFQVAYALLAKAAYDQDEPSAAQAVQKAAVYATDRTHLRAMLENTPPFGIPAPEETPQSESYDPVNSYIHTIQQKAQLKISNQRSLSQLNSIQAFLEKNVDFKPQPLQEKSTEAFQVDLTQQSTSFDDDLATESLARVLQQQGKLDRALAMYEKLVLKFPKKSPYFTKLIEQIKHQRSCLPF